MVYLIVADRTRDSQFERSTGVWCDGDGQLVLGTVYADTYQEALEEGSKKYDVDFDFIDAYELA